MPTLNMPDVGESVTEGTVTRWLKHEGDAVQMDETVVEIEAEKVNVEVPSPFEGRLTKILVQEGGVADVGAPLAEFETAPASTAASATNGAAAQKRVDRKPEAASQTTEHHDERSPDAGRQQPARQGGGAGRAMQRTRRYSPVVLKLASEHDIALELVQGSGIEGRVTRQDVMRYLENPVAHTVPPSSNAGVVGVSDAQPARLQAVPAPAEPPQPAPGGSQAVSAASDSDELQPLSPTRRTIAQRMLDAHLTMPAAWMVVEADVTNLVTLREAQKAAFQAREGVALTYMPFFVQAVVSALKEHRALNASYTDEGIRIHHAYHIGIAVAAESGLIVPVVRDADGKSIGGLARELDALGAKARDRKLTIDDVRGATFTLDNTGAFGSIISQPLIPPGQAAIITTEAIRRELRVADDGSFAARSVINLCISFDHRALDGAQAGRFMRSVKQHLEAIRADGEIY
jgi:2-oxoisovalerate dehydrogenase E2 component (dihydrolipoyl transacylase)